MSVSEFEKLLETWRLGHMMELFQEQNIDAQDILIYLSNEQINDLTKNIGDKIKLQRLIHFLKDEENKSPPSKKQKVVLDYSTPVIIVGEQPAVDVVEEKFEIKVDFLDDTNTSVVDDTTTTVVDDTTTTSTVTASSSSTTHALGNRCSKLQIQDFDLEEFLKKDILGEALLAKGLRSGLSAVDRDRLTDIIIRNLLNEYGKLGLTELEILSKKIEKVFPREFHYTYFVPAITKGQSNQNISEKAKGKLIDKQRNLLYLLKTLKRNEEIRDEDDLFGHRLINRDITQEAKDSHIWLKGNQEPVNSVLEHWKKSLPVRQISSYTTIEEFLEAWPILKSPLAPELINIDFEKRYKIPENFDLETEFDKFFEEILEKRKKLLSAADNNIFELLDTEITRDSKTAIKLYLLSALVPPKGRTYAAKAHWKPSVAECRDSVILHVSSAGDIEEVKRKQIDCMYSKGLTVQPYLLLVGAKLSNVTSVLVVINNYNYKCLNVLEALDFCYKVYQILDAKYPFPSRHIWYLLRGTFISTKIKMIPKFHLLEI